MDESTKRFDTMCATFKNHNFRLTPQRLAVLKVLSSSDLHPSVEAVYQQIKAVFPTTSLATVYKIVTILKEMGEVLELGFPDDSNRYDGKRPYPHPHLICNKCKTIVDAETPHADSALNQLGDETGYRIVAHRFDFYGICPRCQKTH
jgi:Fur family peroxide stress response transcriptional regulator